PVAFAASRQLERRMIAAGGIIGLLFAALGSLLAQRITRPLEAIAQSAQRMRHGQRGVSVPDVHRSDEVGILAQSLQALMVSLTDQERALNVAKESAEDANRAKDHFLAVLSHELRTPLTPLLLVAQYLEKRPLPEEIRADIEIIRRNAELEARLIDDLLDLTRIARGKLELRHEPVDVQTVIEHALDICRQDIADKNLDVSLQLTALRAIVQDRKSVV